MTPDDLSKLSDDEKRVRIACTDGYSLSHFTGHKHCRMWTAPDQDPRLQAGTIDTLPDYLNDLNAALTLCDNRADAGWRCELDNGLDKTWECTFTRPANADTLPDNLTFGQEQHYAPGATLARAICDAFLLTL